MSHSHIIYFTKPEELTLLDKNNNGYIQSHVLEDWDGRTLIKCSYNGVSYTIMSGGDQGHRFYFDFMSAMFSLKPISVVLCGICASRADKSVKIGDVIVATHARSISGKLSKTDITQIELDNDEVHVNEEKYFMLDVVKKISLESKIDFHMGTMLQSPFVMNFDLSYWFDKISTGERQLKGLDMESWFYIDIINKLGIPHQLPVVKGVSDHAVGKDDSTHIKAIGNSFVFGVNLTLKCVEQLSRNKVIGKRSLTQESDDQQSADMGDPKRSKIDRVKPLSWKKLVGVIPDEDLDKIKCYLKEDHYKNLGIMIYKTIKSQLSFKTTQYLDNYFHLNNPKAELVN
jgi:purine-nucleoside phosphorylase